MSAQVIRPRVRRWVELEPQPRNSFQTFLDQHRCGILSGSAPIVTVTTRNPLVTAIAAHVGSREFTIKDLKRHAKVVKGPLQAAIKDIDPGIALREMNGKTIEGYLIKNIGQSHGSAVWRFFKK
jgi:hypothetical protein